MSGDDKRKMPDEVRFEQIRDILERVDNRCMTADGPIAKISDEITDAELKAIYILAKGRYRP